MAAHDRSGRPYIKLSDINSKTVIEVDGGFDCIKRGTKLAVHDDGLGPYVHCDSGKHYLSGQRDDDEHCVGMYEVK